MTAYSEDDIALAAEYALGTLDSEERAQVETMMTADKDFLALVRAWEHKLGVLNQMVGSVEPRPEVWQRIVAAVRGHAELQEPLVLPEEPAPPVTMPIMRVCFGPTSKIFTGPFNVRRNLRTRSLRGVETRTFNPIG